MLVHILGYFLLWSLLVPKYLLLSSGSIVGNHPFLRNENSNSDFCLIPKSIVPKDPFGDGDNENEPSCSVPVDDLGHGLLFPGPSERPMGLFPKWMNLTLAVQGQKFVNKHFLHVGIGNALGIFLSLMFPTVSNVILYTGETVSGPAPHKRYVATILQILSWAQNTFNETQGRENVERSIKTIRSLHSGAGWLVRQKLEAHGSLGLRQKYAHVPLNDRMWDAIKRDLDLGLPPQYKSFPTSYVSALKNNGSVPMSQFDFAVVQWSACGLIMAKAKTLLDHFVTGDELWAFNHYWAVIGFALGMDDEYNLCLQPDLERQQKYFRDVLYQYVAPALYNIDRDSKVILEVAGKGFVKAIIQLFSIRAARVREALIQLSIDFGMNVMLKRVLNDVFDLRSPNLDSVTPPILTRLNLMGWEAVNYFAQFPSFTPFMNRLSFLLVNHLGRQNFPTTFSSLESISKHVFIPHPSEVYPEHYYKNYTSEPNDLGT